MVTFDYMEGGLSKGKRIGILIKKNCFCIKFCLRTYNKHEFDE